MPTLTVTARGQVTFKKAVLDHLGVNPEEKIEIDLLPNGKAILSAAHPTGKINSFIGLLSGQTKVVGSIEEINEAARKGWAGKK